MCTVTGEGLSDPTGSQAVGVWVLEHCPEHEKFQYRLSIARERPAPERFVMRVADRWPTGDQRIFCLREREPPPEGEVREEIERVPILALERIGRKLTVVLDRPRLRRCDFLFLRRAYKNPTEGRESYEQIFWQTQRAVHARRPRVRLAQREAAAPMAVRIAHQERYPWTFPGCEVERGLLVCGDYALMDGEAVRAVVERKTFDNLLADFGAMQSLHQRMVELAGHEHHALVVEAPYEDFLNPKKAHHWGAAFCARAIAELYALHPRLRLVFVANRKTANAWARQFFEAVAQVARRDAGGSMAEESEEILPPPARRGRRRARRSNRGDAAATEP